MPKARYVRLRSTSASRCRFAEVEINGVVLLTTDIPDLDSYNCSAVIKQRDSNSITIANAVEYQANITAVIDTITPNMGTTLGNTHILIEGSNFFGNIETTTVTIDGIDCPVSFVTSARI